MYLIWSDYVFRMWYRAVTQEIVIWSAGGKNIFLKNVTQALATYSYNT